MCSRSLSVVVVVVMAVGCSKSGPSGIAQDIESGSSRIPLQVESGSSRIPQRVVAQRVLRVCADPNNLPFSNQREEGFENRLAQLIARELHARIEYTWWAQRRGFVRETVTAGACDVVPGVPSQFERTLVTRPYYRSSYVFVSPRARHLQLHSFDDPRLKTLTIGVQLIGEDGQNTPPAHALASRHIVSNVVGYTLYGDYLQPNPPARIVDAVANGEVDVAVVWGPLAGYFAKQQTVALDLTTVDGPVDGPLGASMPTAFDISVGVARRANELRDEIDGVLDRCRLEVEQILDEYGIPRIPAHVAQAPPREREGQEGQEGHAS